MTIKAVKAALRKETMAMISGVSEKSRAVQSNYVLHRVLENESYQKARNIGIFISMPQEVSTSELIAASLSQGKRVFVPKVLKTGMTMLEIQNAAEIDEFPRTSWGIPEPATGSREVLENIATDEEDLIIVPAVAVNSDGRRLGHGAGHYDRYLNALNRHRHELGVVKIRTLGIVLACQLINDKIPTNQYDVTLDELIIARNE